MVAKHSKINTAVRAAIAYLFGGKRASGFIQTAQAPVAEATKREVIAEHNEELRQEGAAIRESLEAAQRAEEIADELLTRILDSSEFDAVPDAAGCIRDVHSIVSGACGADALAAFVAYLGKGAAAVETKAQSADAYEGIPQQHHRAVQARLMVAVMEGDTVSPQDAYRRLLDEWKRFAKSGAAIERAAPEEAGKFLKRAGVTAQDYAWGAMFTGSKAALIKAGLVSADLIPAKGKDKNYILPLNHLDGYMAACFGPTRGKIPATWDAKIAETLGHGNSGNYSVWVQFNMDERNVRERAAPAIVELDSPAPNLDLLRELVRAIPPRPLSVAVPEGIKRAKNYPKSEK